MKSPMSVVEMDMNMQYNADASFDTIYDFEDTCSSKLSTCTAANWTRCTGSTINCTTYDLDDQFSECDVYGDGRHSLHNTRLYFSYRQSEQQCTHCKTKLVSSTPVKNKRRFSQPLRDPLSVLCLDCCADQKQYILQRIRENCSCKIIKGTKVVSANFVIRGIPVCTKAWCNVLNISLKRFSVVLRLYKDNVVTVRHGNLGRRHLTEKTSLCLGWMRFTFESLGDYMPHKSEVHLPPTWNKDMVYKRMVNDMLARGYSTEMVVSDGHFRKIWIEQLSEFKIVKGGGDFSKCTTCTQLEEEYAKATSAWKVKIKLTMDLHDNCLRLERGGYHSARARARRDPQEITTLIIDGMDQNKTNLPNLVVKDKDSSNLLQLLTHVTGALHHTDVPHGKLSYVFLDIRQYPHDSNLTMNVLLEMLLERKQELGRTLHTQLDNCYRENKNRFVLCLGALLVEYDIFEEVYFSFLPVGHTHEDVDQMFSKIAGKIKKRNIYTLNDLLHAVTDSYTPQIKTKQLTSVFNIKEWLMPHISGTFGGHSKPHHFRFRKVDGQVRMQYRKWITHAWKPHAGYMDDFDEQDGDVNYDDHRGLICLE
ncbi:uncharacterized protein LOC144361813, partial [Saccoglossus kowalevskii]